ncbi:MAG TPA: DUF6519 domain-containing protein [Pseudonocardiaceae bacterium]
MYGDFSRVTYDPAKHYSSVLYQQGRVRLDAEDNELQAILRHGIRTALAEIFGNSATADDNGFAIGYDAGPNGGSLTIGAGSYYVDGIRVVNNPPHSSVPYWQQPYLLIDHDASTALPSGRFQVYLRVWERTVGPAQDPALREVALGDLAPDTALRGQLVWQVLTGPVQLAPTSTSEGRWSPVEPSPALLMAQAKQPDPTQQGPCTISPASEYRGPENQLYRVEVHTGGQPGTATFKWSRDNGSVAVPVIQLDAAVATVSSLGRDGKTAFEVGDTVELVDDRGTFALPGTASRRLFQVAAVDTLDLTVTLSPPPTFTTDATLHPILRRWDSPAPPLDDKTRQPVTTDGALPIREGEDVWLTLEDGVEVNFSRASAGDYVARDYVAGDYWLIPARVATGDVEWPRSITGQPIPTSPRGIDYHYAQLAEVDPSSGNVTEQRNQIVAISRPFSTGGANKPVPAAPAPTAPTQHEAGVNPTAANRPEITPPVIFPGEPPADA